MKQRPILFSTEMVQAILAGRKTQTRRVVKGLESLKNPYFQSLVQHATGSITFSSLESNEVIEPKNPYGQVGDVLWVREAYCPKYFDGNIHCYKADFNQTAYEFVSEPKWKPSIHMPKDAARIWLRIKDVRVERLQDISDEDIRAEGAAEFGCTTHRLNWQTLWESVNGSNSWKDNLFVWVIEFERIEKP